MGESILNNTREGGAAIPYRFHSKGSGASRSGRVQVDKHRAVVRLSSRKVSYTSFRIFGNLRGIG